MKPFDYVFIPCHRVADVPVTFCAERLEEEGSMYTIKPCPECKARMYLGHRSARVLRKNKKSQAMCMVCFRARIAEIKPALVAESVLSKFMPTPPDNK